MVLLYKHIISFAIIWGMFGNLLFAQEVPKIIEFKRTDYHAAHQNWMITQDCKGFLYVANSKGVLIYNGFKWQLVPLLQNQNPRTVFLGKDCRVYTGGYQSFGFIDMSDRTSPGYQALGDSLLLNSKQEIWNIFGDENAIVFQSFSNLYRYDFKTVQSIATPSNIMFGKRVRNELLIPKIEQGLYRLEGNRMTEIAEAKLLPEKAKIADLCASNHAGEIILGTQYDGLFKLKKNKLYPVISQLNEQLKNEQINKLIQLSNGSFAIGTILNGVYITDDFVTIKFHINKSNGLSNNTVLSLYEDNNRDLWVGLDKGINLIKISDPLRYFYDRQGKLGTIFTTIKYKNKLYLGTNQGLFQSNEDGTFSLVDESQGQIWSFIIAGDDLICGHNNGTYLLKNNQFVKISNVTGGWCMEAISDDRILQSTYTGWILLEKKNGKWGLASRVKNGNILIEKFVRSQNTIIGNHSYQGTYLLQFNATFDQIIDQKRIKEINGKEINGSLNFLSANEKIVLNVDTLFYLFEKGTFQQLTTESIKALEKDEAFAAQLQFYKQIDAISKFENLSTFRYLNPAYTDNEFIIGIDEGYLRVPRNFELSHNALTDFQIDYISAGGKIYHGFDELVFPPSKNDVLIQFKDFTFSNHFQLPSYKLSIWNNHWNTIPSDGRLSFINLDDGEYGLAVKNHKNISSTLLTFKIEPQWFESWPGLVLYTALGVFLLWFLNKRDQRKLKQQSEKLLKEKEIELESERIKAKNEQLKRELLYKSKMLANSTMALIQKNKMLNDLKAVIAKEEKVNNNRQYKQRIYNLINRNIDNDEDWEIFEKNFAEVHQDFLEKLKEMYPNITAGELKLAAYIKMNLSSKEIAPLLNISVRSVENKRYRLRKKMGISHKSNLSEHLLRL